MILKEFRVKDYRSIDDSESVKVEDLTVLIGRNESGKSNLLRALHCLNPSDEESFADEEIDFPRHKEMKNNQTFIFSTWELEEDECEEIAKICPQINYPCEVKFQRGYGEDSILYFSKWPSVISSRDENKVRRINFHLLADLHKLVESLDGGAKPLFEETVKQFEDKLDMGKFNNQNYEEWADSCLIGIATLRNSLTEQNLAPNKTTTDRMKDIFVIASNVKVAVEKNDKAWEMVSEKIPTFIYFDEYPQIYGRYNLREYLERKQQREQNSAITITSKDLSLERLCKVAGIKPEDIPGYDEDSDMKRNNRMTKVSGKLTEKISTLWHNTQMEVELDLDKDMLNVYIKSWGDNLDKKSSMSRRGSSNWRGETSRRKHSTKIHLDQRSLGFRWFFAFYVTFAAETNFGKTKNRILLLDEPGLHLHAQSQHDFLQHLIKFENQIIYTTHSPFMMPDQLKGVRFVRLGDDGTTKVNGNLKKDLKNIQENFFREEIALGLSLEQSKRLAPYVLIVEGDTDVAILRAVSSHFRHHKKQEEKAIRRNIAIKAADGVGKVRLFTSILFAEKVGMMVLLDHEPSALIERVRLLLFNRVREANALTISAAFGKSVDDFDRYADIEDVLGNKLYGELVEKSYPDFATYKKSNTNNSKKVNDFLKHFETKQIVKCYEALFERLELKDFEKIIPIEVFCKQMEDPKEAKRMIQGDVEKRFEQLFERINQIENDVFDEEIDEDNKKTKKPKA